MDRKLTAVVLGSLVLLSVLGVGAAAALSSSHAAGNQTATVTTSATGEVTAEPDRAVVHLAATATADNASGATSQLAANVSQLRDALEDENLSVVSVRTTGYELSQESQERPGQGQGQGPPDTANYVARQSFAVTTNDTDGAGAIIDAAVNNGATEVHGVSFTLSEDRRQELRAQAIDEAVTDAEAQAQAVADSTDLTLGEIRSVSTGDGGFGPVLESAADQGTVIDAGPVTVSANVEVTYNATND